jgi:enoyl-CoA hydratase
MIRLATQHERPGGAMGEETTVTTERRGHVLLMGLNRPTRRNAFTLRMFEQLALAYGELERDPELRCGVLFAHGEHFTGGLDLAEVAPAVIDGAGLPVPEGGRQPWRLDGPWTTPVVIAVQGWCITIGIELLLAAVAQLQADSVPLFASEDGAEGMRSFVERRPARFSGR